VTTRKHVYLIEDDPDIRALVTDILGGYGYAITAFGRGGDALEAIRREAPALCIVDLGLPDMDGLGLVRQLWQDVRFGVIILTGRGAVSDRVVGLELGADDYIVKPFEPRELVARVNSVIRRHDQLMAVTGKGEANVARFGNWVFDIGELSLVSAADGRSETLTAAEAALLLALLKTPRRVLSREQLQGSDWERDDLPFDRSIDVRISRIRKKIEADPKMPRLIKTVYGAGYLFAADVEWGHGTANAAG
jgi:DNA-binding response OmpR family regulator